MIHKSGEDTLDFHSFTKIMLVKSNSLISNAPTLLSIINKFSGNNCITSPYLCNNTHVEFSAALLTAFAEPNQTLQVTRRAERSLKLAKVTEPAVHASALAFP
jgi:hypothetical protein